MHPLSRAFAGASLLALAAPAWADDDQRKPDDILIIARQRQADIEHAPAATAAITATQIATTVNAINVEDAVKYLPSLVVRKRHIGDTQAPLATRTSGLGASARSLIYADGALLSSLIGNNNTLASPRWSLVSPQEIARIDVLYGPFSAAYPGNAIGAVVNITTRLPEALEATATASANLQRYDQYATRRILPAYQFGATMGDRFGALALFASYDRVESNGQPLSFVTAARPATASATGTPVIGGFDDINRTNAAIRLFGASGFEHQVQDHAKLKAALDLTSMVRLTYVGGLFVNATDARAETYLASPTTGLPVYAGSVNSGGRAYTIAPSAFSGGTYRYDERHWSHALSATGTSARVDWQVIGTSYDFAEDIQRMPTVALPDALAGGAGTITRLDGTGWRTLDAKALWRSDAATHSISAGAHDDRFMLASNRYATADWRRGGEGALVLQSLGKTRTSALWVQDAWRAVPTVTVTMGGRYEWWRAYDGANVSASPAIAVAQPPLSAHRFSPKAAVAWDPDAVWTLRFSFGEAYRFPTVAELYQVVTTPVAAVPNPNLRPERALSEELSLERHDAHGTARVSLFNESVRDALIAQTGPLNNTAVLASFVQNVDRTRARGVEAAFQRTDVVRGVDLTGSVTYTDSETRKDTAFPAAVGKLLPTVPRWKATAVATWRPADTVSLTAAARYSSRLYGTLDNSDIVGNTYQGFYKYLVVDLRAVFRIGDHYTLGLGIDNVGDDRYFLFHPFPQRSFQADLTWRL